MRTVIVTDARYRTATAVIRPLARAGYAVCAVQTIRECPKAPPAFASRHVAKAVMLDGSVKDAAYAEQLFALCRALGQEEKPVLFPIGADTLSMLSKNAERFRTVCDFLVASPEVLDQANDKRAVAAAARKVGVPVPQEFDPAGEMPPLPVILKPRCGEKLGLHAQQRYAKAYTPEQYRAALQKMTALDPQPVVQELIDGAGAGVCAVLDEAHRPVSVICHRRVREYPIEGGPSACCVSFYDEALVARALKLLHALDFVGIAMVEFKGECVLEINPRIWGSFPLTEVCDSRFAENYVRAACGEVFPFPDNTYRRGRRMRFLLNDTLATLSYLRHGKLKRALGGVLDVFRAKEALFRFTDQRPFWRYLAAALRGKGGGA